MSLFLTCVCVWFVFLQTPQWTARCIIRHERCRRSLSKTSAGTICTANNSNNSRISRCTTTTTTTTRRDHRHRHHHRITPSLSTLTLRCQPRRRRRRCRRWRHRHGQFTHENPKVRHHDHVTGRYVFAACNSCNLQLKPKNARPMPERRTSCR